MLYVVSLPLFAFGARVPSAGFCAFVVNGLLVSVPRYFCVMYLLLAL